MTDSADPGLSPVWRLLRYWRLLALAAAIVAADQGTKALVVSRLRYPTYGEAAGAVPVVRGFFYIVHVGNTGAAWSLFTGRSLMLAALAVAALAAIVRWRRALGLADRATQVYFGLICGGIVGNLVDRIARGHVVDFLDVHFGSYVYPTFNVADSAICVGAALYLWTTLRSPGAPF